VSRDVRLSFGRTRIRQVDFTSDSGNPLLENHSRLVYNREVFLVIHRFALDFFSRIDENFRRIGGILAQRRDKAGHSHVSLVPFVLVMQRQLYAAFELIAGYQSFQAWVLLRPCLESALIIGKWVDDPSFATVWEKRNEDFDAYRKAYFGRGLESRSLPRAREIRLVLSRINDDFMHTNQAYYMRHVELRPADTDNTYLLVHHVDQDPMLHEAHLMAMINLLLTVQDSLVRMFGNLFGLTQMPDMGLEAWQKSAANKAAELMVGADQVKQILVELGLWPVTTPA